MPSYLGVRRKQLDACLQKLFCLYKAFFFFFSFENRKGGRILIGKIQAHGLFGLRRGMWLVVSATEEPSEEAAPVLN